MKKDDIDRHSNDGYGAMYPAVKVKVYDVLCTAEDIIAAHPECSEAQAQQALEFAWESECRCFWDYWQDERGEVENGLSGDPQYAYFPGQHPRAYSVGRSSGWLIVQGLPPVEEWDAVMVSRWNKFQLAVLDDVKYRMSKEVLLEGIEANQWYKERSSQYNFTDTGNGKSVCLADVRADVNDYAVKTHGLTLERVV